MESIRFGLAVGAFLSVPFVIIFIFFVIVPLILEKIEDRFGGRKHYHQIHGSEYDDPL